MSERRLERVLLKNIHAEEGVSELLSSSNMRPALFASFLPARRAAQIDPREALRAE